MRGKQLIIISKYINIKIFHGDIDEREHLTLDEFISNNGISIDSFVIMKGAWHLKKFYFEKGFTPNTTVGFSEFDYLTNELAISLIEYFNEWTSKSTIGRWRILLWDEFISHIDYDVKN